MYVKGYPIAIYMKCLLEKVPEYRDYKLSLERSNEDYFIIWNNPQEDKAWRESAYGEYYGPGEDASFAVLGIDSKTGGIYTLSGEDKYYRVVDGDNYVYNRDSGYIKGLSGFLGIQGINTERFVNLLIDDGTLDPNGYLKGLLKDSFQKSLWEMD